MHFNLLRASPIEAQEALDWFPEALPHLHPYHFVPPHLSKHHLWHICYASEAIGQTAVAIIKIGVKFPER